MQPARRLGLFSAAIAVIAAVLAVLLPATLASAQAGSAAGTRVGASHPAVILTVRVPGPVSADEGRGEAVSQCQFVVGACVAAEDAGGLASRVDELQSALDPIAQNSRTTAVMSTEEGTDILASGGRDLSPAQRALANEGDILARSPGAHAEITALEAAEKAGLTPSEIAVSRAMCPACQAAIESSGGVINDDLLGAYWP